VTGAPAEAQERRSWRAALGTAAVVLAVGAATVAGVLFTESPVLAFLPAALLAWQLLHRVPLRLSAGILLTLLLVPDDKLESPEQWHTPISYLGDLMHDRLDAVAHVPGLAVTGMEVFCLILLWVALRRRGAEARVDGDGRHEGVPALRVLFGLYLAGVAFALLNGMAHGQGIVPWKVRNLLHPLLLALVFGISFRGPADHRFVARIVVFAATFRAVLAIIVQRVSIAQSGGKFATATSHGDSVLFAVAIFLLLVELMERPPGMRPRRTLLLLPILLAGAQENGRRLVWVMLLQMLVLAYLYSPFRGWKRSVTRLFVFTAPVVLLYVGIGWSSTSKIFAPIATLRSVADTSQDHSAYWREVENWNLSRSIQQSPVLGAGLGGRYTEFMFNDDISTVYKEYREWPHNTVLGMFFLMGLVGFVCIWSLWVGIVFVLSRAYRHAIDPAHRAGALALLGTVMACHALAYGDTGAHYAQYKVFIGLVLALGPKLAVATGAWPGRREAAAMTEEAVPATSRRQAV
jgi:O-antigen ligase